MRSDQLYCPIQAREKELGVSQDLNASWPRFLKPSFTSEELLKILWCLTPPRIFTVSRRCHHCTKNIPGIQSRWITTNRCVQKPRTTPIFVPRYFADNLHIPWKSSCNHSETPSGTFLADLTYQYFKV